VYTLFPACPALAEDRHMLARIKLLVLGAIAVVIVLSWLAGRLPRVGWLQVFRFTPLRLSEVQARRHRRSANMMAGVELVFTGFVLPALYAFSTMIFFGEGDPAMLMLVVASSVLCIVGGIAVIIRSRRD
jgi:hypothetical protein